MEKQRTREEIDNKYKWDLTKIYKDEDSWYKDLEELKEKSKSIKNYETNLFDNKNNLKEYLLLIEDIDVLANKLYHYANLHTCADASNVKYQKMLQEISDVSQKIGEYNSFYSELFYKQDYDKLSKMLEEDEFLSIYKNRFERNLYYKDHYLPKDKEELISKLSNSLSQASDIYDMFTDTELKYGTFTDSEGKTVELTDSNYKSYISQDDRKVRKEVFNLMYDTMKNYKNTLALTYSSDVEKNVSLSKIYNYNSVLEQELFADNVPIETYDNLIKSVHNNLDKLYNYYKLKKDILKLDEMHLYDIYAKVVEDSNKEYSYEEAKELVLKALQVLGEDYVKKASTIFEDSLVDVYNNVGKTSGAFSSCTYDTYPYILLNYEGKYNDVSTLAHELGHSMHSLYSKENNFRTYADYTIFVAEVASTTNELLLAYYLLDHSNDKKEKLAILNELLDDFKGTIYRQTMFAEFEREMYKKRENNEPLTNDVLCDYYYELNKKYFGPDVVVDDEIKYEWQRVPHFYRPFYVYKYATSMAAATYIADRIYNNDKEFTNKYIEFLSMGDRMFPVDELKTLGLDMTKSDVIDKSLEKFQELIDEFIKIYNELKEGE